MAKEVPTIKASPRDKTGSRYSKRLRAAGRLPAVIYGHGSDPLSVHVDEHITVGALKQGLHVINLEIEGKGTETCLVKDLQFGFLGDNVIHMDLARVNLDQVVEVMVSIEFFGAPEAAKKSGTVVVHEMADLKVSCKVRDIPDHIRIDLTTMQGETFTAGDVKFPAGVSLASDPHGVIVRIQTVKEEAAGEAATPAAAASTAAAAPAAEKKEEKK
ncbi:MAG: 50S ribosomal protein L25 [Planctomycetaceae bacterium]|jgi:large subunit ribosomal protein L25|nr:50S ribosomal protein L25 [Planctomycetaceae bacterium]